MKKFALLALGLGLGVASFAQKAQIRTAKNYLGEKEYEKALKAIDQAVNNESTQDDPYAWATRGLIYLAMQQLPENKDKDYYTEAGISYKKAAALKPDYEREDVNSKLFAVAIYNFNNGLNAYDKQQFEQASKNFGEVVDIAGLEGGKRFSGKNWVKFDTISHQAALYQGYAGYYSNKFDEAQPLLEKAKTDPIVKTSHIYLMLADIYEAKNDEAKLNALMTEARAEYPKEKTLINRELNYYIKSKKTDVLVKRLEDAIKMDPSNSELYYTLALAYDGMANPKDKDNKDLPKPANYSELFTKAEEAYNAALKVSDKPDVNYSMGALYFNRAVVVNEEMNTITGTSSADIKKYDGLKAQRDEWFGKALPYLEKTVSMYDPQAASLRGEDKNSYMNALVAAKEIYAKKNNLEKATEFKKKLEEVNK